MAENPEQKGNISPQKMKMINKAVIAINLLVVALVVFQLVSFYKVYSGKNAELFAQGRIINIAAKDNNKLELNDISDEELALRRSKALGTPLPEKTEVKPEDFIGPMPEINKEDFIGPMPDTSADKEQETKPAEEAPKAASKAVISLDYKAANLSIIVTEIGMMKSELDNARNLPKEVSFAFSPYSDELQKKIDFAIRDGRQVLLNVIFNPSTYPLKDGGPLSIQANYDEIQNLSHFGSTANSAKNYIGLLANNDEIITSRFDKLSPLLKKITERNVFFGFFRNTTNANLENDVKPFATDTFAVDYLIDEELNEEKILEKLNIIKEELVIKKKRLVIAVSPNELSIKILQQWLDENIGPNIQIAPVSYFITNN